jgi:hypothetical protein
MMAPEMFWEGVFIVTEGEAIEKCARAILRSRNEREDIWRESLRDKDFAEKLVVCLKELGLLPPWTARLRFYIRSREPCRRRLIATGVASSKKRAIERRLTRSWFYTGAAQKSADEKIFGISAGVKFSACTWIWFPRWVRFFINELTYRHFGSACRALIKTK